MVEGVDGLVIYGDVFCLWQVFDNLFSNVVKYIFVGGCIEVSFGVVVDGQVEFVIFDNGVGMGLDDLLCVFELYFCMESVVWVGIGGIGFGMGIV